MAHNTSRGSPCGWPDGHKGRHISEAARRRKIDRNLEWRREKRANDPEWAAGVRARAREAAWRRWRTDPQYVERSRFRQHHISKAVALAIYEAQGAACRGCDQPRPFPELVVDHDHAHCERCANEPGGPGMGGATSCGESIRGLLCRGCNLKDVLAGAPALALITFNEEEAS
jgi:hypothetical protein